MAARCLSALGRLPEAYEEMAATSREATERAEADPKYVRARDAAATELALLERRVGRLTIVVVDPPPGTVVTLDGKELPAGRRGQPVAVTPGRVTVEVRFPGAEPVVREASVAAAEAQTITFSPPRKPETRLVIQAPPAPRVGAVRIAGIVVGGVGAIGMAVFGAAGTASNAKFSDLERACGHVRCQDPSYASTVDAGKTLDIVANAALTAGLVGLVGGGLMIAFGGPKNAPVTPTARGLSFSF
jgi:hypothetical protein